MTKLDSRQAGRAGVEAREVAGALRRALDAIGARTDIPFRVLFADGTEYRNRDESPEFTLRFSSARVERRVAAFGHVGLLEAYFDGDLDVEGNFALSFRAAFDGGFDQQASPLVALRNRWHEARYSN